jgi:hypothetical protein
LRLHLPNQLLRLLRDVTQVDAALLRYGGRQQLLDGSRKALDGHRVVREQAKGLDVEHEAWRRAVHPELRVALRRQGIIGRVDLDDGELAGIVSEPVGEGSADSMSPLKPPDSQLFAR